LSVRLKTRACAGFVIGAYRNPIVGTGDVWLAGMTPLIWGDDCSHTKDQRITPMTPAQATVAQLPPVAVVSDMMFAPGDEVKAKSSCLPFWMTVDSVNPRNGFCRCSFGSSGNDAGNFHQSELVFNGGALIQAAC